MAKGLNLYEKAGVDVFKGDRLVDWLQSENSPEINDRRVVSGIGGFAALYRPDFSGMTDPLLVSSTDGVGTKVLLAIQNGLVGGLGQDLVGMCVNDLYTVGAKPMFFLDYYATGALDETLFKEVLKGIKRSCQQCSMSLLGGETAEMPGLYKPGDFDLAGFVVGIVDAPKSLRPELVQDGDLLFALPSSGFHSNGYSLIRRWLATNDKYQDINKQSELAELVANLLIPTRIYHEIPNLLQNLGNGTIHGLANITGGGISGNLVRVLPPKFAANIDWSKLPIPIWMQEFIADNRATIQEVEGVFNLGCGMIAVVDKDSGHTFSTSAKTMGLEVYVIGEISADKLGNHVGSHGSDKEARVNFYGSI